MYYHSITAAAAAFLFYFAGLFSRVTPD